MRNSYFNLLY